MALTREAIESFLATVRLQSVSEAANALFVSQSTISHRLQVLEAELNTKLFYRQRGFKHLTLTAPRQKRTATKSVLWHKAGAALQKPLGWIRRCVTCNARACC